MKIRLKRVLISLVVVIGVVMAGVAILLFTFDPNAYKSKLEQIVYERYHRTLAIKGDIELSLFPRIALAVQDVSLSDRDSADTFASLNSARFAVAIWPLLFNRLVVDHVSVTGFRAWLVRDTDGRFNFSDLVGNLPAPASMSGATLGQTPALSLLSAVSSVGTARTWSFPGVRQAWAQTRPADGSVNAGDVAVTPAFAADHKADFQIDIAGLDLKGGEIHFLDRETGSTGRLVELDVNTGRMTFDQAFDVSLKGKLLGDKPQADARLEGQALIRIDPLSREYSAQRVNLSVVGQLDNLMTRTATLKGNLAYSEYSQMFSASSLEWRVLGDIQGDTPVKNLDASLLVPNLRIDRSQADFQVSRLALRAKGEREGARFDVALDAPSLSISPEAAAGEPVAGTYKLSRDGSTHGVSLEMTGLGGNAFDLTLEKLKLDSTYKQGGRLVKVEVSSPASWSPFGRRGALSAMKGDVRIEDAALSAGSFAFPFVGSMQSDLYKDEFSGHINAVLAASKIDFTLAASHLDDPHIVFDLSADKIDLNALFPPPPVASGSEPVKPEPVSPEAQAAEKPVESVPPARPVRQFDWSFLDSAHVQGNVNVGALKTGGMDLTSLSASVSAQDGLLEISDIKADLYGGSVLSNVSFSSGHDVTLDLVAVNVDVAPVVQALTRQQRLSGDGDLELKLATQGLTVPAMISGLDGTVTGHIRDGAWTGFNLNQTIAEAGNVLRNAFSGQVPAMIGRFDGTRQTDFKALDVRLLFQNGQGTVQNLTLESPTLQVSAGAPASVDLVNQQLDVLLNVKASASAGGSYDFSSLDGVTVPIRVSGAFKAPSYQVQWKDIRDRVVKDAIEGGLLDILTQEGGTNPFLSIPSDRAGTNKPGAKAPLKSIGDALKGLLKP